MRAFYNEIDRYCCDWLQNLMDAGHITAGKIDDRSIADISPDDVAGFERVHFFAGIAGWEFALQLADWPRSRPVWTGSCPCQPFSVAGAQRGTVDKRHLWPEFRRLIEKHSPPVVFGEQVASPLGREWLSGVRSDLESLGYAVGGADLCAAGVQAPHIRQRLWFVADADGGDSGAERKQRGGEQRQQPQDSRLDSALGDSAGRGCREFGDAMVPRRGGHLDGASEFGGMAHGHGHGPGEGRGDAGKMCGVPEAQRQPEFGPAVSRRSGGNGYWDAYDLIGCTDGKARRIEPGTFPLAHGIPKRTSKLRAYGNAIVSEVGAEFIGAYLDGGRMTPKAPRVEDRAL